ncbi:MAG: hypothetical protein CMA13_00935 [Euryarchaeota archaeon]|nr:hypothetical protein [Euryarchaeota archaeon]OUV27208.1 MAG: hypothetical protein CBC57_01210 [Euryarchaeota archaeon TMED97]|tara:strand:- start:13937 stop:14932 length:996 start_codon:yes stop_codon:yes gene_type:complete
MKSTGLTFTVFLLLLTPLSGCIEFKDEDIETSDNQELIENSIYSIHCQEYDYLERCWKLLIPESVNKDTLVPLVVDIHGYTQDMDKHNNMTGFDEIAIEEGFIVVYPDGYENSWNAGDICCGVAHEEGIDDLSFLLGLVQNLIETQPVDKDRIYVSGWSNGCGMTQMLAVEASELFAAAGCMSFYLIAPPSSNYTPIPFMEIHGLLDDLIVYGNAGLLTIFGQDTEWTEEGAIQNLEDWKNLNNCEGITPEIIITEDDYDIRGYSDCENGAEVRLMTLYYGGHNPYAKDCPDYQLDSPEDVIWSCRKNPTGIESTRILWDFMNDFSKSDLE